MPIATGSTLLLIPLLLVWVLYSALRIASYIEHRWKIWGEVIAFLLFFAGSVILEVLLIRA